MGKKRNGIAICGSIVGDVHYTAERFPVEGSLVRAQVGERHAGGIGNLIGQLSRLAPELPLEVSCVLGTDSIGDDVLAELAAPSVDFSRVARIEGPTSHTLVIDSADTGERTFFSVTDPMEAYDEGVVDFASFGARVLLMEYLLLCPGLDAPDEEFGTHGARFLSMARAQGMITAIDVVSERSERAHDIICAALPQADVVSINEVEAEQATGIAVTPTDERAAFSALDALAEAGVRQWAVIHMPERAFGLDCATGERVSLPSLKVSRDSIRGTTGAGDAYMAGMLYGTHEGWTLKESMRLARASAACSLFGSSGFDSMRTVGEVLDLAFELGERR